MTSQDELLFKKQALYQTLASIPAGYVISYGQLAKMAGLGNAARWVGRELGKLPEGTTLPWHRVISASGRLSLSPDSPSGRLQRERLFDEGVIIDNNRVNIRRYGWPNPRSNR